MKHRLLLFLLPLALGVVSCTPGIRKLNAFDQVRAMRQSVLLVPLDNPHTQAEQFQRYGRQGKARRILRRGTRKNQHIVEAFRDRWSFCPVYFYYREDERAILGSADRTRFLNASLQPDASIAPKFTDYYLAEIQFMDIEGFGGECSNHLSLVIYDQRSFIPQHPFPSVEKVGGFSLNRRNIRMAVRDLDLRLSRFYQRAENFAIRNGN